MATLTGFKATNGESGATATGQHNPVFVFDEVNVGDGAALEDNGKQKTSASGQQQHQQQHQQQQHQMSDNAVVVELKDNTGIPKQQPQPQPQHQNSTLSATSNNRNGGAEPDQQDGASVSMLAIDCAGKSPRQPRRSPLMALFRGKPRESTRKLYTDEDQFEIEWANLSLRLQKKWYQDLMGGCSTKPSEKQQAKLILNGVDGRMRSGEITAVLGPSGAGKTSLLNGLFGKYRSAIEGSIKVTGAPSKKHLTVCTIPQSDYLISYLTTEESLWFASRLKNCEHDFNHDRNIERVVELLGLQRCRYTRINKLSGGQYKRVSIAQEMLSSPDILVLDEPTSGLDSLTCYRTVKVLRDLVEASKAHNLVNPMSIILTIHQPHREVLDLFHSVYIMAVGGQTLYQGPPNDMDSWISDHSGLQLPSKGYNPASFMVEIASEEYGRQPIQTLVAKQRAKFRDTTQHQYNYQLDASTTPPPPTTRANNKKTDSEISLYQLNSSSKTDRDKYIDIDLRANDQQTKCNSLANRDIDSRIMTPRSGKNSDGVFWRHVSLMSRRCFLANTRDPLLFTIRVGAHIFIPLVVALIYGPKMGVPNGCPFYMPEINLLEYASVGVEEIREKHDAIRIQFQNVGLHFMVYYAFGLCMLAFTAISFPLIMHVLIKEIRNGWYSLSTFIMGKMFAELPMAIILPPISVAIIYTLTGQPSSYLQWRYMVQSVILILIIMIAEAKGLIFGAVCMNSMQTAVFAASVSTVPFILLSGFLIRIHEIPVILQHLAKFSYFKHSVEALIITRYGFGMCPCDPALIPVGGVPRITGLSPNIMSVMDYYVSSYVQTPETSSEAPEETNIPGNNRQIGKIMAAITTLNPEALSTEPTTLPPTTMAAESPTTPAPAPAIITTQQPTNLPPTTLSTESSSISTSTPELTTMNTQQPTTLPPTSIASDPSPTSSAPTTTTNQQPTTTMAPSSTSAPTTSPPTTLQPTTVPPTTASTSTSPPTTLAPSSTITTNSPTTLTAMAETSMAVTDATTTTPSPARRRRRRRFAENGDEEVTPEPETDAELIEKKPKQGLFFNKLASLLTRANAFGFSIETCKDVEPFTMKDMKLEDSMLAPLIGYLFLYIVILKFISYFIVEICVKLKL